MYEVTYKIEILKECVAGLMADYFQYKKTHKLTDEQQHNYDRLKEMYNSIIYINDIVTLDKIEKEIMEYKGCIDELQL